MKNLSSRERIGLYIWFLPESMKVIHFYTSFSYINFLIKKVSVAAIIVLK